MRGKLTLASAGRLPIPVTYGPKVVEPGRSAVSDHEDMGRKRSAVAIPKDDISANRARGTSDQSYADVRTQLLWARVLRSKGKYKAAECSYSQVRPCVIVF